MAADEKISTPSSESVGPEVTVRDDASKEKRLVRKLDMRIMPIVCLLYLFACMFGSCHAMARELSG